MLIFYTPSNFSHGLTHISFHLIFLFIPNVISLWNSLPESVVCAPSLSVFKQSAVDTAMYEM